MKNFTKKLLAACIITGFTMSVNAQSVGINADGSVPDNSAMLDVKSTNKGLLPPRMTSSERNSISSPAEGLMIFNTETHAINVFTGTYWVEMSMTNPNWTCGEPFYDQRDGKIYNTALVGFTATQCWMTQNLNVGTRINGSTSQSNNYIIEKYCYNNLESNCDVYGGLYQWDEMMLYLTSAGTQGICPTGWHMPTDAEWSILVYNLMGESTAGGAMKEAGTTHWNSPNIGATNSSGFTGLPGGICVSGGFVNIGNYGYFRSSTAYDDDQSYGRSLIRETESISSFYNDNTHGMSIRCIKDN